MGYVDTLARWRPARPRQRTQPNRPPRPDPHAKSSRQQRIHYQMSRLPSLTDASDHACMEMPTLEQLRRTSCWWWVHCENSRCLHTTPMALTPLIIRWGADASSDRLRRQGDVQSAATWGDASASWSRWVAIRLDVVSELIGRLNRDRAHAPARCGEPMRGLSPLCTGKPNGDARLGR
jgi:hypothetical protein